MLYSFAFFSSRGILLSAQQDLFLYIFSFFLSLFPLRPSLFYAHIYYIWPHFTFPHYYFPRVSLIPSTPFCKEYIHIAYFSPSASFLISIQLSSCSLSFFLLVFFLFSLISPSSAPITIKPINCFWSPQAVDSWAVPISLKIASIQERGYHCPSLMRTDSY